MCERNVCFVSMWFYHIEILASKWGIVLQEQKEAHIDSKKT